MPHETRRNPEVSPPDPTDKASIEATFETWWANGVRDGDLRPDRIEHGLARYAFMSGWVMGGDATLLALFPGEKL